MTREKVPRWVLKFESVLSYGVPQGIIIKKIAEKIDDEKCKRYLLNKIAEPIDLRHMMTKSSCKDIDEKKMEEILDQLILELEEYEVKLSPFDPGIRVLFNPDPLEEATEDNGILTVELPYFDPEYGFDVPTVIGVEGPAAGGKTLFLKSLLFSAILPKEYGGLVEEDPSELFIVIIDTEGVWRVRDIHRGLNMLGKMIEIPYMDKLKKDSINWLIKVTNPQGFWGSISNDNFNEGPGIKALKQEIYKAMGEGRRPIVLFDSFTEFLRWRPEREHGLGRSKAVQALVELIREIHRGGGLIAYTNQIYEVPNTDAKCFMVGNYNFCPDKYEMFGGSKLKHETRWRIFVQQAAKTKMSKKFGAITLDTEGTPRVGVVDLKATYLGLMSSMRKGDKAVVHAFFV